MHLIRVSAHIYLRFDGIGRLGLRPLIGLHSVSLISPKHPTSSRLSSSSRRHRNSTFGADDVPPTVNQEPNTQAAQPHSVNGMFSAENQEPNTQGLEFGASTIGETDVYWTDDATICDRLGISLGQTNPDSETTMVNGQDSLFTAIQKHPLPFFENGPSQQDEFLIRIGNAGADGAMNFPCEIVEKDLDLYNPLAYFSGGSAGYLAPPTAWSFDIGSFRDLAE